MTPTLASLKDALQQPFPVECIQFLPKEIRQENGKSVCSALPYANKRVYEDRLNELIFGEWSTPYTPPYAQGNKLIVPVTVVVLGTAHTDYGESFLMTIGKNGTTREDENTVTEAYSQAFRRACAQFLLGRYLYDLAKLPLPYDPKSRQITVSKAERIAWVETLYQAGGLLPKRYVATVKPTAVPQSTKGSQELTTSVTSPIHSSPSPNAHLPTSQTLKAAQAAQPPIATPSVTSPPTSYPNDTFLDWVCRTVKRDPSRLEAICTTYNVTELPQLSVTQRQDLTRRQRRLHSVPPEQQTPIPSEATLPMPQQVSHTPDRVDARLLAALLRILSPEKRQDCCRYYHVADLADLTAAQALHLSEYIEAQKKISNTSSRV